MLLVIDVGNTNTVLGIFKDKQLIKNWRIRTERNATEDEVFVLITSLFSGSGIQLDAVEKTIISSVVPPVVPIYESFCRKFLNHNPAWVDAKTAAGMPIRYGNPSEVGADRIVNAVAGFHQFKTSLIIIDFGTATTFDYVSGKGEYIGGAIAPGVMTASEALFRNASKLPRVELNTPPESVIGLNTIDSIKSGLIYGYAAMVDGMVARMKKEVKQNPKVIATGGLAPVMQNISETIEAVVPDLTLTGLRIIGENL